MFLAINGYELPEPSKGAKIDIATMVNQGRNNNGVTVGQRVGRDIYKIDTLEWKGITAAQWAFILNLMKDFYFYTTFTDPLTLQKKTIKTYCGDRSGEALFTDKYGNPTIFKQCSVNIIDCGE